MESGGEAGRQKRVSAKMLIISRNKEAMGNQEEKYIERVGSWGAPSAIGKSMNFILKGMGHQYLHSKIVLYYKDYALKDHSGCL